MKGAPYGEPAKIEWKRMRFGSTRPEDGAQVTWPVGAHCILMTHALAFTALRLTCHSGRVGTAVSRMHAIQE